MLRELLVGMIAFSSFACGNGGSTESAITGVSSQFTVVFPSAASGTEYSVYYQVDSGAVNTEKKGESSSFTTLTASEKTQKVLNGSIASIDLKPYHRLMLLMAVLQQQMEHL